MNVPENWTVKLMIGGAVLVIGVGDLTFGSFVSAWVLALLGALFIIESVGKR